MRTIILQDVAAMIVETPGRMANHPILSHFHRIFKSNEFNTFVEKMRHKLQNAQSPMDYNLQAVLPGVHTRMNGIAGDVRQVSHDLERLSNHVFSIPTSAQQFAFFAEQLQRMQEHQQQMMQHACQSISEAMSHAATGFFGTSLPRITCPAVMENSRFGNSAVVGAASSPPPTTETTATPNGFGHVLHLHSTVRSMYNEWYGLGEFESVPVAGGIEALEKEHGRKWRRPKTDDRVTRQARICRKIRELVEVGDRRLDEVLDEWSEIYKKRNCNLKRLIQDLQEKGILSKNRNRGQSAARNAEQTA
jgi:uncharacterized protein YoxC